MLIFITAKRLINNDEKEFDTELADSVSSDSDSIEIPPEASDEETDCLRSYLSVIESIVDRLFDLSILIRGTSRNVRSSRASMHVEKDANGDDILEEFERIVEWKIKWLCQETEDWLAKRLAKAITMRRRHFYYQKRHCRKLAVSNIPTSQEPIPERSIVRTRLMFDNGNTVQMEPKVNYVEPRKSTRSEVTKTDSGTLATELKPEEEQKVKVAIANIAPSEKRIGENIFPDPPKEPQGKAFQCTQCFLIQPPETRNKNTWR